MAISKAKDVCIKPFYGDVQGKDGKMEARRFAPGNIVTGQREEDREKRKARGVIGSEEDLKKSDPSLKKLAEGVWQPDPAWFKKNEGSNSLKNQAKAIVEAAKAEAEQILKDAKAEASKATK